ncbi:MAG: 16S rRNA (cytidine(1402)-2'-O)-methyltransferase [Myxococcota bacterium]
MSGTLYVVATPIGNLEDMTPRAARVLREVDVVYAEDTRHSRPLLAHIGVAKTLVSLHEHNERERVAQVQADLGAGKNVALLCDAGTPAVSDPGAVLVAAVAQAGFRVVPIAGASALAAALSVAGFAATDAGVLFLGFLPVKGTSRRAALDRVAGHAGIVVLYEAPHRIARTLADLADGAPTREACLGRELTKVHEELLRGTLAELARTADDAAMRGEMTLVLGPLPEVRETTSAPEIAAAVRKCLDAGLSARDAATAVSTLLPGVPRRDAYQIASSLRPND